MPSYPKTIKAGTFSGIVEPTAPRLPRRLGVQRLTDDSPLENAVDLPIVKVSSLEIACEATSKKTTDPGLISTDAPADYDGSSGRRICFVPLHEQLKITWKFDNYALVTGARLEIYRDVAGTAELVWSKSAGWSGGACPDTCETTFGGDLNAAPAGGSEGDPTKGGVSGASRIGIARSGTAVFPDNVLTAEFAPYLVRVAVTSTSSATQWNPASRWLFLDVLAKVKTLYWGDPKMVPAVRDDDEMDDGRKDAARVEELAILNAFRTATNGSDPQYSLGTGNYEVPLPMPVYKVVVNKTEEEDHTDFVQTTKYWGGGPRLPILAEIVILTSDGKNVSEPKALGNMKFLWDWEDVDDPAANPKWQTWLDGGADDRCKNFATGVIKTYTDHSDPLPSDNCPAGLGGKRGAGSKPIFLPTDGYDPRGALLDGAFPFAVAGTPGTRGWTALSTAWRSGLLQGYTGALFQPSRMAGDKYKITVFAYFDPPLLNSATKSKDLRTSVGTDASCASGYMEVFRKFNVTCAKRGTITDLDWTAIKGVYKNEAGIILNVTAEAVDEDIFKTSLEFVMDELRRDGNSLTGFRHLPLFFDYGLDLTAPANSPAIPIRDDPGFKTQLDSAFRQHKIYRLKIAGDAAQNFKLEDVRDTNNSRGIVVKSDATSIWVLSTRDEEFQKGRRVRGSGSDAEGAISEVSGSFWEAEVATANSPSARKVKVTTASGEHTISFLPFEKTMSSKTKATLAALVNKTALERPASQKLRIAVAARESDADDTDRRTRVKTYIESLLDPATGILVDRQALLAEIKTSGHLAKFYPPDMNYGLLIKALMQGLLNKYAELQYGRTPSPGVLFYHLPGRDTQFKVKSTGGFFPEISRRNRGIAYVGTWNGGGYATTRQDGSPILYKSNDSVAAHELGHALFVAHALEKTGRRPPPPLKPQHHILGSTCIMNYDQDSEHFCSFCMFRLRGWDWDPFKVVRYAVKNVRITDAGDGRRSKCYTLDAGYPAGPPGDDSFHFAPHAETAKIRYTIEDAQTRIKSGKLTLSRVRDGQVLWSRALTAPEYADGDRTIDWDGLTNGAGAYFADNYITPEHSPYKLGISVEGEGFADPPLGWAQFEVQLAPLELSWGPKTVLAISPPQGTTAAQLATVNGLERDHQAWEYLNNNEVPAPYTYLGATGIDNLTNRVPAPDETKKIYLVSNVFYTDVAEQNQNAAYTQMRAAWGDGPNIPLFVTVKLKKSDDSAVSEPLAAGNLKFLWDWKDATEEIDEDPALDPTDLDNAKEAHSQKVFHQSFATLSERRKGEMTNEATEILKRKVQGFGEIDRPWVSSAVNYDAATVPTGTCCHAHRGGKRGLAGCTFFPAQPDPGTTTPGARTFPFEVSHTVATNRTWTAVSSYQKAGTYAGQSGVLFQPPAIAGDAYQIIVYGYYPAQLASVNVADVTGANAPASKMPANQQATTGRLEVWREIHVPAYYKKNAGLIGGTEVNKDMDFDVVQDFLRAGYVRVRVTAPQGMTQGPFDAALAQVVNDGLSLAPPPGALPKVIAQAIDPVGNFAHGDYLIHFRDHAGYRTQLETTAATAHGGILGNVPPLYWTNILPDTVKDPYNPAARVWKEQFYTTEFNYQGETKLNWSRQAAVRLLEAYALAISANPPDGIYILQADGMSQFGSDCVAFGGPFLPTKRNRSVFIYAKYNSNCVMEESSSHEFGHCLFLNHGHDRKGDWFQYHSSPTCLMTYNFGGRFLCGACALRVRGWSLYQVNPGGGTTESMVAARDPDTGRAVCPKAGDNPTQAGAPTQSVARKVYPA